MFNALKSEDSLFARIEIKYRVGILEDGREDFKQIQEKFVQFYMKQKMTKNKKSLSKEFVQKEQLYKQSTKSLEELKLRKSPIKRLKS